MPASNKNTNATEQTPGKKIEVDENLVNGPLAKRGCTDPLCCLLFLGFIGAMVGIAGYALSYGNPTIVGRGYDADGKICGYDEGYENYPYLYFPYPGLATRYRTATVCLMSCPSETVEGTITTITPLCHTNSKFPACDENNGGASSESAQVLRLAAGSTVIYDGTNPGTYEFYIYNTVGLLNRFCVPASNDFKEMANDLFESDLLESWISDIRQTWQVILASMGVAFLIGFIYMILMRFCSGVLTWSAIIIFIAGTGILGWRFYQSATELETESDGTTVTGDDTSSESQTITTEKVIAYICWGVAGLTLLAVLCLWGRIRLAIAILKAAADYVKDTPSVFFVPIITVILLVCLFGYWGLTAVYLISCGDAEQIENYPFGTFEFDSTLQRLLILHLFGLLWFNAFIIASTQFIMASSTCIWYFSQGTGQSSPKSIRTSVWRLFRYHFGSIAFGSLVLAIVQFIRIILAYIQAQANKLKTKEGKIVQYVLACLQCYGDCFERFIKFLNKQAYIQIALGGKNFCKSAWAGFQLIIKNPIRFSVVGGIGTIFVFFGKVFVASITALIGFLVITNWEDFSEGLSSPFIPTIVMFVFAYVIGACFMTVYGMAGDAIFACFLLDEEIHSRKNSPPLHCPESLKAFLNKYKKN